MRLILPLEIWQQIQGYVRAAKPNEVTGFGTIKQIGNDFVVDEVFIPEQKCSAVYCETAPGAINDIIFNLIEDNPARAGNLRFRWHSHVDGPVYWSATDEGDIATWDAPWVVNLVTNTKEEKRARLDVFTDEIKLREIELEVYIQMPQLDIPREVQQACTTKIREKVAPLPPVSQSKQLAEYFRLSSKGGDTK